MSNYPEGAESYLNRQDDYQAKYDACLDDQWDRVLDEIESDPLEFNSGYEIMLENDGDTINDGTEEEIERTIKQWAQRMQRDSAWAAQCAGKYHAKLLDAFQHKLELAIERNLEDY